MLQRLSRKNASTSSFMALLLIFLTMMLVGPLIQESYHPFFVNILFSILILSSVFVVDVHSTTFRRLFFLAILSAAINSSTLYEENFWLKITSHLATIAFFGIIASVLFRRIFFAKKLGFHLALGAVTVYLLIGVIWSQFYAIIDLALHGSFAPITDKTQPFLYFSFVTQSTLGYGDITPTTTLAQNTAVLQAIVGQFYIAILVGGLVALIIQKRK